MEKQARTQPRHTRSLCSRALDAARLPLARQPWAEEKDTALVVFSGERMKLSSAVAAQDRAAADEDDEDEGAAGGSAPKKRPRVATPFEFWVAALTKVRQAGCPAARAPRRDRAASCAPRCRALPRRPR